MVAGDEVGETFVIVKFNISTESQPPAFTPTHSNEVDDVKRMPRQK